MALTAFGQNFQEMNYEEILQKLIENNEKSRNYTNWNAASAATNEIIKNIDSMEQMKLEAESLTQQVTSIENEISTNSKQAELFGKLDDLQSHLRSLEINNTKQIDQNIEVTKRISTLQEEVQSLKDSIDEMEKKEKQYNEDIQKKKDEQTKREEQYDSVKSVLNDLLIQSQQLKAEEEKRLEKLMGLMEKEIQIRNDMIIVENTPEKTKEDIKRYNAIIPNKKRTGKNSSSEQLDEDVDGSYEDSFVHVNINLFENLKQNTKDSIFTGPVSSLCFANANPFIATGGENGYVKINRTDNTRQVSTLTDTNRRIMSMSFSPSDILFATASYDTVIRYYNIPSFTLVDNNRENRDCVNDAKFLSDDKIVSCCRDQTVKIYNVGRSTPINSFTSVSQPYSLSFYQTQVVSSHHDGKLRLWDPRSSARPIEIKAHKSSAIRAICIPHTSTVVSIGTDRAIVVNDLRNIRDPYQGSINIFKSGTPDEYMQIAVTEDSAFVGGSDGQIYNYSLDNYKFKNSRKGHEAPVICVAVKPSIGMMVSGDRSGNVIYWKKEIIM